MKFKSTKTTESKIILANDHYAAVTYDCSDIEADENGVIKAGTILPANDGTAVGVLLDDVDKNSNPNGTIVVHGFIREDRMPAEPTAAAVSALDFFRNCQ